jgi:monoamine oxidase
MESDILIIGAGATGLMAALELGKAGRNVIIVEGQERIGGRIHTLHDNRFAMPVELGAEFIHGDFPVTTALLKEAGIKYYETEGKMFHFRNRKLYKDKDFIENSRQLEKKMDELETDISINDFLDKYFHDDKYKDLRQTTRGFVEGYDAADANLASTFAFRKEWSGSDMKQYRIEGGYIKLIEFLKERCQSYGIKILIGNIIREVSWKKGAVEAKSEKDVFKCRKIIVTVPPPVLLVQGKAAIVFTPLIDTAMNAARNIGFGNVIKLSFQFEDAFWENKETEKRVGESLKKLGFLISDAYVPTWWTQLPKESSMITGWLAGPKAKQIQNAEDDVIKQEALHSLAFIFQSTAEDLDRKLKFATVTNWAKNPFAVGAYSYATLQSPNARKILKQPVEDTIYFAGEALDDNGQLGTVEAALQDGKRVAEKILSQ